MSKKADSKSQRLTHVGDDNRPLMVDVIHKVATPRRAVAQAVVHFPAAVAHQLREQDMRGKKGPIIDTAIIAGVMAAKRTHELIPFCHPLMLENCAVHIEFSSVTELRIECEVSLMHKTGVEMEALTGASIAALTIYDMCKALSHEIVISEVRLLEKSGGKGLVVAGKKLPRSVKKNSK
jgi:cyclic pyranopterin phosphate synthase